MRTGVYATNDVHNVTLDFCDATMIPDAWNASPLDGRFSCDHQIIHGRRFFLLLDVSYFLDLFSERLHLLFPWIHQLLGGSSSIIQKNGM